MNSFLKKILNKKQFILAVFVVGIIFGGISAGVARAAINPEMNYQGKLTTAAGATVTDGSYNIEFKLYTASTGGSPIWTEDDLVTNGQGVGISKGLFSLMLGSTTAFTGVNFNQTLYLGVNIGSTTTSPTWDGEMSPRKILGTVPSAFVAQTLNGITSSQFLRADIANSTSSPTTFFSVTQSGTGDIADFIGQSSNPVLYVQSGGNVGIGTSSPFTKLAVNGSGFFGGNLTATNITATGTLSVGTLTGLLQANAGLVSASSTLSVAYGGTGLSTAPSYGQLLLGNAVGGYTLTATSSLGLPLSQWTTNGSSIYYNGGNVGIGTTSPSAALAVAGNEYLAGNLTATGTISIFGSNPTIAGSSSTGLSLPFGVYVSGHYAYVADAVNGLLIFDISNPASPVKIGSSATGLSSPRSVYVSGHYAYMADNSNGLVIFDVSNPAAPVETGAINTDLGSGSQVAVSGHYAYVTDGSTNHTMVVFDVSNPAAPVEVGSVSTGTSPSSISILGHYAYVADGSSPSLSVVDISNPAAPVQVGLVNVTSFADLKDVYVAGRYAYLADDENSKVWIVDISNPTSPSVAGSYQIGSDGVEAVSVAGRYAYVNTWDQGTVVLDISNPAAAFKVGSVPSVGNQNSFLYVSGQYAYVADESAGSLKVLGLGGAEFNAATIHSLAAGNLQVENDIIGQGNLQVAGGITAGTGGIFSQGSLSVAGDGYFTGTSTANTFNVLSTSTGYRINGQTILTGDIPSGNIFLGDTESASTIASGGIDNFFVGSEAGAANTSGSENIFLGSSAGSDNISGSGNIFEGDAAGLENTTGSNNIFQGNAAGFANIGGGNNIFQGENAGGSNISGDFNLFQGQGAGAGNTTGSNNVAQGAGAGSSNDIGSNNIFVGEEAGAANNLLSPTGDYEANTILGVSANFNAGNVNASTTELGYQAGYNNGGNLSTLLGYQAGYDLSSGNNEIVIGQNVDVPDGTVDNQLNIGNLIYGTGIYSGAIPSSAPSGGKIGIGTTSPWTTLSVAGNVDAQNYFINGQFFATATGTRNYIIGGSNARGTTTPETGSNNFFEGNNSGSTNTTGTDNIILGRNGTNTTGNDNIFEGPNAGSNNSSGSENVFIGDSAGSDNSTGSFNLLEGKFAADNNFTGSGIVGLGFQALKNTTVGSSTALGYNAGLTNSTGALDTFLGYGADALSSALTNATAIGANATVGESNALILGAAGTNVGIGTTSPFAALSVAGDGYFTGNLTATNITATGTATFGGNLVVNGTGTSTIAGNLAISGNEGINGNIIPALNDIYTLGSPNYPWASVYIGPGSLFVNGQEVVHTDPSQNVNINASTNQSIITETFGSGNLIFNPSGTGNIQLEGNVSLTGGDSITTTNSSPVSFGNNGVAAGNITISGNSITATNTNGGISLTPAGSGGTYVTTGNFGIGTTSPATTLSVNGSGYITGGLGVGVLNTTAGTLTVANGATFGGNLTVNGTGTSTFAGPINLSAGCFAVAGSCLGAGSGTVNAGLANQVAFYNSNGTVVSGTSTLIIKNGSVGIGTSSPWQALGVVGNIDAQSYYTNGRFFGAATGTNDYIIGDNTRGTSTPDTGGSNFFVGIGAGNVNTTGGDNFFEGTIAGNSNTTGFENIFLGPEAGEFNTVGHDNNFQGFDAGGDNTTGHDNIAIGDETGEANTTGANNIFLGSGALGFVSGDYEANTLLGAYAGAGASSVIASTTELGYQAGYHNSGNLSTLLGYQAGFDLSSGNNEIAIGQNVDLPSNTTSNQLNIGNLIYGTNVYSGSSPSSVPTGGNIGIGTTSPWRTLSVQGSSDLGTNALAGSFTATSTTATSTFAGGLNITGGCLAVNNACFSTGSGVVNAGLTGQAAFYNSNTNAVTGTSTLRFTTAGLLAVATTTPNAQLTVSSITTSTPTFSLAPIIGQTADILDIYKPNGVLADVIGANGNLGLGTTTPAWNVQIVGASPVLALTDTGAATNQQHWFLQSQGGNFYIGTSSSNLTATTSYLRFDNASNHSGTAVGYAALSAVTTGTADTAFGYQAGAAVTGAFQQTLIGYEAGFNTTNNSSQQDTDVGYLSGFSNTTGSYNTYLGSNVIGSQTGSFNTLVGANAGFGFNATGANSGNVLVGYNTVGAASAATTNNDTIVGYQAGFNINGGSNNTLFGYQTGTALTSGGNNIFLGYQTASTTASGSNNIALGYNIDLPTVNGSNQLDIGNLIYGTGVNGSGTSLSTGSVGIGTTTPWRTLSVQGSSDLGNNALAGSFTGTSTATSTFAGGLSLSSGCVTVNGTCLGFGSGTVNSGLANQVALYNANGTIVSGTSTILIKNQSVGINYTNPTDALDLNGNVNINSGSFFNVNSTSGISIMQDNLHDVGGNDLCITSAGEESDVFCTDGEGIEVGSLRGGTHGVLQIQDTGDGRPHLIATSSDIYIDTTGHNLIDSTGNFGIGTTTPGATLAINGNILASSTATSTFYGSGVNITKGCFSIAGTCIGSGSGTVNSGTAGQFPYYAAGGTAITGTSSLFITSSGNVGIGTVSPGANKLYVYGSETVANTLVTGTFVATSSAELPNTTITAENGLFIAGASSYPNGILSVTPSSGSVNIGDIDGDFNNTTLQVDDPDNVITATALNTLFLGGNVGIGTTTPGSILSIAGVGNFVSSATSTLYQGLNLASGCYAIKGLCIGSSGGGGSGTVSSGTAGQLAVYNSGGTTVGGTSTLNFYKGNLGIGTTTPGSLLSIAGIANFTTATSTFYGNGINLSNGCFSINGTCIGGGGGGGGSQWTTSGSNIYYTAGNVGIGTTSPYAALSVVGASGVVADNFTATDTMATSTFAGGFDVGNGSIDYDNGNGITTIGNLQLGALSFPADAGIVSWADLPVTTASASSTVESYSAQLGGSPVLTVYGLADGSGNINSTRVGIGTTSPETTLSVVGSACISKGAGATTACSTTAGTISADAFNSSGTFDLAENYTATDPSITAGDLVAIDPAHDDAIVKATPGSPLLGAVSTKPGLLLGFGDDPTLRPVALAGRVPVKVSLENGAINRGDYLTISPDEPGVAMLATTSGEVIGQALQAATSTNTLITAFIKVGWQKIGLNNSSNNTNNSDATTTLPVYTSLWQGLMNGVLSLQKLTVTEIAGVVASFQNVKTDTIQVQKGIEMTDTVTGQPYCITIAAGQFAKTQGTCGENTDPTLQSPSTTGGGTSGGDTTGDQGDTGTTTVGTTTPDTTDSGTATTTTGTTTDQTVTTDTTSDTTPSSTDTTDDTGTSTDNTGTGSTTSSTSGN